MSNEETKELTEEQRKQLALDYYKSDDRKAYSNQRILNKGVDFAGRLKKRAEEATLDCKKICKVLMSD